jgi:hypothetical protein
LIGGLIHAHHKFISQELRHSQNSTRDRACPDVPYRHRTEDGRMHRIFGCCTSLRPKCPIFSASDGLIVIGGSLLKSRRSIRWDHILVVRKG